MNIIHKETLMENNINKLTYKINFQIAVAFNEPGARYTQQVQLKQVFYLAILFYKQLFRIKICLRLLKKFIF